MKTPDTYKEVRTFNYPGWTIRVHIPDLTEEERARRMHHIRKATENVMKEVYKLEKKN